MAIPDWLAAPLRGLTCIGVWALVIAWCIGAPVVGILAASYLLAHPPQRILVPLSIIATIYVTLRVARALIRLSDAILFD